MRILVSPRSLTRAPHPALNKLTAAGYDIVFTTPGEQPGPDELTRRLQGCVGWIAGVEPIPASVVETASELRVISRNGTGVDNLPLDILAARGIEVVRAEGRNANGVAELAMGLMLESLRYIAYSDGGIRDNQWRRKLGRELAGLTVGVVGCGAIGSRVARLSAAFGARIQAYDMFPNPDRLAGIDAQWSDLDQLLACSDIVTLHCAPPADGGQLIDADAIARMYPGVRLINTARAALVDNDAVLAALNDGHICAFATDVFDVEPPLPHSIFQHPCCIATAHIGGFTEQSLDSVTHAAVDGLLAALDATIFRQ